jgi:hypothetical protein
MYYASMLRWWQLVRIPVRTNHPCLRVGCHTSGGGKSHVWWENASMVVNCLSNDRAKYFNVCCWYSILNGAIDSREVRAQKATQSSQSSGTSSVCHSSEDELEIIRLKEVMRQRDEYYSGCLAQQQPILQISCMISLQLIEHLEIVLVLIICITTCILHGGATSIWHVAMISRWKLKSD